MHCRKTLPAAPRTNWNSTSNKCRSPYVTNQRLSDAHYSEMRLYLSSAQDSWHNFKHMLNSWENKNTYIYIYIHKLYKIKTQCIVILSITYTYTFGTLWLFETFFWNIISSWLYIIFSRCRLISECDAGVVFSNGLNVLSSPGGSLHQKLQSPRSALSGNAESKMVFDNVMHGSLGSTLTKYELRYTLYEIRNTLYGILNT